MAKRPTRLRFTEDDLADSHVKKAADRADKAVDRAEKAADKLASKKAKPKLKLETDAAGSRKAKLRFEKAEFTEIERPSVAKHMASRGAAVTLTSKAHRAVSEYEDDNIGVQAVQETTKAVESTVYTVDHAVYSHKLKAYDKAEKLVEKSDKANVNALYEKFKKDNPDAGSNPFSRWQQKRAIKKEYAAAKAGKNTASTTASASKGAGKATGKAAQGAKNITERVTEFCTTHSKTILFVLIAGLLFMILSGCSRLVRLCSKAAHRSFWELLLLQKRKILLVRTMITRLWKLRSAIKSIISSVLIADMTSTGMTLMKSTTILMSWRRI